MKKSVIYILIFSFLLFIGYSCNNEKICTMEFRMIQVTVKESDNSIADIDKFCVVKALNGDTILTDESTFYNDPYLEGLTIFTDNEMKYTNTNGCEFILTCYKDTALIVNEKYTIKHDDCHIELLSGKTLIKLQ